jgi:bifunctional non-homologous end joining protein LigD
VKDGEIVVLEGDRRPSFQKLQRRALLSGPIDIPRASVAVPASFYAFDLLAFEDFDLRSLALEERKSPLRWVVPRAGPLRFSDQVPEQGVEEIRKRGLEGLVAKKADGPYCAGRSRLCLEVRLDPSRFTIRSVPRSLEKLKEDPLRAVLTERPELPRALSRLAERLEGTR